MARKNRYNDPTIIDHEWEIYGLDKAAWDELTENEKSICRGGSETHVEAYDPYAFEEYDPDSDEPLKKDEDDE